MTHLNNGLDIEPLDVEVVETERRHVPPPRPDVVVVGDDIVDGHDGAVVRRTAPAAYPVDSAVRVALSTETLFTIPSISEALLRYLRALLVPRLVHLIGSHDFGNLREIEILVSGYAFVDHVRHFGFMLCFTVCVHYMLSLTCAH